MKQETFKKLKDSKAVIKIDEDQMVYILTNANGNHQPKLYGFLLNVKTGKPLVNEVTSEEIMLRIVGE